MATVPKNGTTYARRAFRYPYADLIRDSSANLYGTTYSGGSGAAAGTVFKLDTSGNLSVLHSFQGNDGAGPRAAVIRDSSGNLYGTADHGGTHGYGIVFRVP